MPINIEKTSQGMIVKKNKKIQNMRKSTLEICEMLTNTSIEFSSDDKAKIEVLKKVYDYTNLFERLLYSCISEYVYNLNEDKIPIFTININYIIDFVYSPDKEDEILNEICKKDKEFDKIKETVLRLQDNIDLAVAQKKTLKQTDEEFDLQFKDKISTFKDELSKDMNTQLLTLVGMFTALAFLVFGGISYLDNIFSGAKDIPILKLVITGSIWSFCMMNLIFVFILFIGKLINLPDDNDKNFIQKNPLVCWYNYINISILVISSWMYFINKYQIGKELSNCDWFKSIWFVIFGSCAIVVIMYLAFRMLYNKMKETTAMLESKK